MKRTSQERWDAAHPEVIKKSQEKYRKKNPSWSFRPGELKDWLESQRVEKESNSQLLHRLLRQLKETA